MLLFSELESIEKKGYSDITANEDVSNIKEKLLGNAYKALFRYLLFNQ